MSDHAKYSPRRFHPRPGGPGRPVLRQIFAAPWITCAPSAGYLRRPAGRSGGARCGGANSPALSLASADLLEQLEANCERSGIRVHWAPDTGRANAIILGIAQKTGWQHRQGQVHGEAEVGFNHEDGAPRHPLKRRHGGFIVQLDGDTRPHHHARHPQEQREVSDTFAKQPGSFHPTTDVDALIRAAGPA